MQTRLAALCFVLLSPGFALAEGCHDRPDQTTAMSCVQGTVWSPEKGLCVPQPSS